MYKQIGFCAPDDGVKVNVYYGWEVENPDQWDAFPDVWEAYTQRINRFMRIESALAESVEQARGE